MSKKALLVLGLAWTGTAAAASSSLDDVTMNIVNETAFQEIINADPADVERILQVNANAQPVRSVVLQSGNAALLNAAPINSQVLTVNKELNQGFVSFSFICAEGQDCQQRVESLNTTNGFVLSAQPGQVISLPPAGLELAPLSEAAVVVERAMEQGVFAVSPVETLPSLPVDLMPLESSQFNLDNMTVFDGAVSGAGMLVPAGGQ